MTPTRLEPIWVASRIRWASPPERVRADLESDRYPMPTLTRKESRSATSLTIRRAIARSVSVISRVSIQSRAPVADISVKSLIEIPPTVTARLSGLSRAPWQEGQSCSAMYSSIRSRLASESDS